MNWLLKAACFVEAVGATVCDAVVESLGRLGDGPAPEPVTPMAATAAGVVGQLAPEVAIVAGEAFFYDPDERTIELPDPEATDLDSRIAAAHEATHARRQARGVPFYQEAPLTEAPDQWTVGEVWALFREEAATNRELRRWLWQRLGLYNPKVMAETTKITTYYFHQWAKRFFTGQWRGRKAAVAPVMRPATQS